jgi:hypothetical protein
LDGAISRGAKPIRCIAWLDNELAYRGSFPDPLSYIVEDEFHLLLALVAGKLWFSGGTASKTKKVGRLRVQFSFAQMGTGCYDLDSPVIADI